MSDPTWRFRRMQRAELNTDPMEGEFFTPQGIADALIRESIQNSLDARLPGSADPVRVRVAHSGQSGALSAARAEPYLRGLQAHLAAHADVCDVPAPGAPIPFLTIEDFGTRGLTGDPMQSDDPEQADGSKNHFYYFWRNVGRSAKEQQDLGRWGLGKTVFPACSAINSFFGLTRRSDDGQLLLMGQSVMTVHKIESQRCSPYGYFAAYESGDDFARPLDDPTLLARFCEDFKLQRDLGPGLSVVVPFPDPELDFLDVIRSSILQYFYPIIAGRLCVQFQLADSTVNIDSSTIESVTESLDPDARFRPETLSNLYQMARWAQALPDGERVNLEPAGISGAPTWSESLVPQNRLEELKKRFEQGERLAIRAFIPVQRKGSEPVQSELDIYLQRDDSLDRAEEHYVRQGITIPGIRLVRDRGVRCLAVVEHPQLSSLLGDSENPAHTDWLERRPIIKKRYEKGASTIRFVRSSLREIVRILARPPEGREENLLQDVFFLDLEPDGRPGPAGTGHTRRRRRRTPPPPPRPPEPRQQAFRIEKKSDGFQIIGNAASSRAVGHIVVRAAYGVRRGDPFKNYMPLDFQLDRHPIQVGLDGAGLEAVEENRMVVRVDRPDFRVQVNGFDVKRDLVVSVRNREATQ